MAAWFMAASIALMVAFCAWTLAGLAEMVRDEAASRREDRR